MLDAIKRVIVDNIVFLQDTVLVLFAFNTVKLLQCKTVSFLSSELWPSNSPEITPLTTRFRDSYSSLTMSWLPLLYHQHHPRYIKLIAPSVTPHPVSGINFLVLSVNLILATLSLSFLFMLLPLLLTLSTHHSHHP